MRRDWGSFLTTLTWTGLLSGVLLGSQPVCAQLPQIKGRSAKAEKFAAPPSQEAWYRIEYDGKVVGHESLATASAPLDQSRDLSAEGLVRRIRDTRIKLRRFGNDLSVSAHLETVESADGILHSWSLRRTGADGSVIERTGIWNPERSGFEMTEKVSGIQHRELLTSLVQPRSPIFPAWLDSVAQENSRLSSSAVCFPETAAVVDIEIRREGNQSLKLSDGKSIVATRCDYWPVNRPDMKSSVYFDKQKSVVRIEQTLIGQMLRLERTDAAGALGKDSMEALDLQFRSVLPLKRQLSNLDQSPSLRLTISVGNSEQIRLPSGDFQTVEQISGNELLVTLLRPRLPPETEIQRAFSTRKSGIDPACTAASRWITSDNEDVKRMGIIAAGGTSIPSEKCRRLTLHVRKHMRVSSFSTSMQPASAIIRNMRGDCTEHAVLLSTLMRAQGIPSRVVVGFIYVPNPPSFAPHMWTEAFLDGKWMPFDSTVGPDRIGLTHLKVTDSALSDEVGSGTVLFIPLLSFLGRATIDVAPSLN